MWKVLRHSTKRMREKTKPKKKVKKRQKKDEKTLRKKKTKDVQTNKKKRLVGWWMCGVFSPFSFTFW